MYCDIKVQKLFKGGNYSRAENIRGNTVYRFWISRQALLLLKIAGKTNLADEHCFEGSFKHIKLSHLKMRLTNCFFKFRNTFTSSLSAKIKFCYFLLQQGRTNDLILNGVLKNCSVPDRELQSRFWHSTKARMANFYPQIIISNFFLIFLQDSRLGSTQQMVKKWLIGKEFLPPAKQYFFSFW